MSQLRQIAANSDARALAALVLLWLLFFWRLFTPSAADQASLAQGDFSGQFVAFGGYQYARLAQGQIPLWNPYNNGGLPFIADTQAAVFYPPRWLTIGLSALAGGWSYNALQLEMAAHVLLYIILMYGFLRRLTLGAARSHLAAFVAALIIGYGGFTTGYAPLQLAILEAATWLPLVGLGILEATRRQKLDYRGLALAGCALGLAWLAGHPQTSWFLSYLAVAYFAWRCYGGRLGWRAFLGGGAFLSLLTFGLCAVTLLPGLEYLRLTARDGMGFAAKGNGFHFRDLAQFIYPGAVSQWWPQYVGLPALFFIAVAVFCQARPSRFWLIVACVALLQSLGENGALYHISYNLLPGLRFFRGQERAAFLVANSLAILAGLGVAAEWQNQLHRRRALRYWLLFSAALTLIAVILLFAWSYDAASWGDFYELAARSAAIAIAAYFVLSAFSRAPQRRLFQLALVSLIVFELFSVNLDYEQVYDSVPHSQQLSMRPPPLVQQAIDDMGAETYRVDGFRGLQDNYGSLYAVMDMRGISPLFLKGPGLLIYRDYVNNALAWELFAVKYVFSEAETLAAPTQIIGRGQDRDGSMHLHRLADPRPFARLLYQYTPVDSDEFALALLEDPRFDPRQEILLQGEPTLVLPEKAAEGRATVLLFEPEEIALRIETTENAILSLALPHYPGWAARLNGEPVEILRAYTGLSAVEIPAGQHTLTLHFAPLTYHIGAIISLISWLALLAIGWRWLWRR